MALSSLDLHTNPSSFPTIDQWSCPTCTADNPFSAYPICTVCEETNLQLREDLSITDQTKSTWTCPQCTLHNDITHENCTACGMTQGKSKQGELVNLDWAKCPREGSLSLPVRKRRQMDEVDGEDIFRRIVEFCREKRTHFVDGQFVPSHRSIGSQSFTTVAQWLRISHITPLSPEDNKLPWTVFSSPKPSDIQQGALGNCWLVAALALVSERPTLLDHILLTKSVNSVGAYLVRICHNGLWTTVVVDDYFPCTAHKHLVFTQAKHRQMYVPLIEKACAKIFGGYANLTAGTLMEGLQLMTGAPCDQIDLQPIGYPLDGGIVWAKLLSACEFKLLIGVSSGSTTVTDEEYASVRIHKNHAFSILAAHASTDGSNCFVLVRDPHSHSQYREASVTNDVLEELRQVHPAHRGSGAFWISWRAFLRYFSSLTISTYKSDHFDVRQRGEFTRSPTQCVTTYQFQLDEPSRVNISLIYHRHTRQAKHHHVQSFLLCDLDQLDPSLVKIGHRENILLSTRGEFTYWSGSLRAGLYVLLPFSISFWHDTTEKRDFTVVIHSTLPLALQIKNKPATFLADRLISSVMISNTKMEQKKDMISYLKPSRSKLNIQVVENTSNTEHLIIDTNIYANPAYLRHSRRQLITRDCIPPRHRQIIFLAEWTAPALVPGHPDCRFTFQHTSNRSDPIPTIDRSRYDLHTPQRF